MEPDEVRVDTWTTAVRLFKTRSAAAAACRGGHVQVNDQKVKPAVTVRPGDRVEALTPGGVRIVVVRRAVAKRVGAAVAATCYDDRTPPPPPKEAQVQVAVRERGAGRPTKRERRQIDRLRQV